MRGRGRTPRASALAAAALLCAAPLLATHEAGASGGAPARFAVLQAAYYAFGQAGPTHQRADERAVLLEHASEASGPLSDVQHNASDALVNSTTRTQLVLLEYQAPAPANPLASAYALGRFQEFYQADRVPTSIFDGTKRMVAFGQDAPATYLQLYEASRSTPAGASIMARGGIVLTNGYLEAEAAAVADLAGARVYLYAALVEDPVPSPEGGRGLRFVVRTFLGGIELTGGHAEGRFNFTRDPGWIESRLGAALWVQSDGPSEGTPPPADGAGDGSWSAALLVAAPAIMIGVLAVLILGLARREQSLRR